MNPGEVKEEITFCTEVLYAVRLEVISGDSTPACVKFWIYQAVDDPEGRRRLRCKRGTRGEPFNVDDPNTAQLEASGSMKFDGCANLEVDAHTCDGTHGFSGLTTALMIAARMCSELLWPDGRTA